MELYVWSGRRSDALRQYEECVRVLKEDIGTSPQEKTTELYEAIKENRMPVAEFHPRKSADARRNNLPRQLTSFIGREREIAEVKRLLSTIYLLTLTGSGGCGKTRLALQVAADLVEEYSNGVWLVELASLSDPSLVPQAVARALDVSEQPGRPLTETLSDFLRPKSLLLMLDNCEHLIEACARLSEDLLHACPNLKILATSREALGIAGETPWRVPSLSLPDPQRLKSIEASVLTQYEAVRLFIDRAATVLPSFTVTNKNASVVAQICCRLDGIPLAIELGAARVKVLSVEQIADRLDDRFRLLTGGSRTAIPRHQTLLATIDWSYDLLSEAERALLRRLSVFAGGWTLPAAEAVCVGEGIEGHEILDLLTRLVDKSMVMVVEHSGEARYRLLETIRQYGRDKLLEAGEESVLGKKHLEWFLALTEEAEPKLNGPDQVLWLERLEPEHDNLRAALGWSLRSGEGEHGLRLARALERFWRTRGYISEVWRWHEETLSKSEGASASLRAKVLRIAGDVAVAQGNIEQAVKTLEESLALSRVTGDKRDIAYALLSRGHMGLVVLNQDDYGQVVALLEEGLALFQGLQDKRGIAESLRLLGEMALRQGDYSRANALLEESLALFQELGDKLSIAISLHMLGDTATRQGDYNRAKTLLEDSLSMFREIRSKLSTGQSLHRLGLAVLRQGDYDRAEALFEEGLTMFYEAGMKSGIAECLEGLAELAGATGQLERAGQLSGAAEALREAIRHPIQPSDRPPYDRSVAAVRARLGEEAFAKVWEEGRKMKLEEAIEWAGGSEHDRKFC
jgi:non-specific serine/threonine protein kinase